MNSHVIQQLEAAKEADLTAALDPTVSAVRRETFLNQMNQADRVAKELSHGYAVQESVINAALWMPPKHISRAEREQLIQQLEHARRQDGANEQQMLNDAAWSDSAAPVDTARFDQQKQQVDRVVKNLTIGAPVHWSDIRQALVVPPSPY